jgi:transcriptional regulator of acetoin/glycerol metabolism
MYHDRILARDNFLSSRQVNANTPPVIAESWNRSLSYNVDFNLRKSPKVLKQAETQVLQTSSLLYHAFQTIIPKIKSFASSKYSFILADNHARLLSVYAEEGLKELLKTFNAVPGGVWSEELCGTTAFGTTLVAGKSVVIQDAQHFCESWQMISCAGVPIFHPISSKTIGVLDLTCFTDDFPANAVVLTEMLAKSLEMEVLSQLQIHKLFLENAYLEKELRIANDILIAVNSDGQIVRSNDPDIINQQQEWNNQFDWHHFFQMSQEQSVIRLSTTSVRKEHPLPFSSDSSGGCLQFVYYRDQIIGAIIQMLRKPMRTGKLPSLEPQHSNRGVSATIGTTKGDDETEAGVIGKSSQWLGLLEKIKKVAKRDMSVLLIGESGTGKEVLSQYIHSNSLRKDKAFVAMNCATLAHDLVASELFGYAQGSFTGGMKEGKAGLFEAAHGGTVFLDEIAELPLPIQAMLLRVLQEKQVTRIGEYRPRPIDVKIIAATNQDLKKSTEEGKFRLDLYYRLNVIELKVPSLRERKDDIVHLAEYFLRKQNHHSSDYDLMPETVEILRSYDWPGNVREMKNVIEHALVFADNARILPAHLPDHIVESAGKKEKETQEALISQYEEDEQTQIMKALRDNRYNLTKTAKQLRISRGTLYKKMEKYQIK